MIAGTMAFALLLLVFAALLGWGAMLQRLAPRAVPDEIILPFVGGALLIALGGLANLLHAYTRWALLGFIFAGAVGMVFCTRRRRITLDRRHFVCWIIVAGLLSAIPPAFNTSDDPAYLTFVAKLIALGDTGEELFSLRRLFTFGGHFPLSALFLDLFGVRGLSMVDPGLGTLLIGWLVSAGSGPHAEHRAAGGLFLAFLLLSIAVTVHPMPNTLPALLPMAFVAITTWMALCAQRPGASGATLPLMALFAAAAISIRPLPLAYVAFLAVALGGIWYRRPRSLVWAAIAVIALLLPMMLAMHEASRTLFYPFLGQGTNVPGGGTIGTGSVWRLPTGSAIAMLPTLLGCVLIALSSPERRAAQVKILAGSVFYAVTIALTTPDREFRRYTFLVGAGVLLAQLLYADITPARAWRNLDRRTIAVVAALLLAATGVVVVLSAPRIAIVLAKRFAPENPVPQANACRAAQARVFPGATILVIGTTCVFTMDFRRNPIVLHDRVGAAMPPLTGYSRAVSPFRARLDQNGIDAVLSAPLPSVGEAPAVETFLRDIRASMGTTPPYITAGGLELRPRAAFR